MLTEDRKAEQARRRATATVAVVVGIIATLLAAAVVFLVQRGDKPGDPNVAGSSPGGPVTNGPVTSETLEAGDVTYSDFYGVPLPVSPAGPHEVDGRLASGFDRSPAGLVLAAVHITYRVGSDVGPAVFEPTIEHQMVGSDRATFLAARNDEYATNRARYGAGADGEITSAFEQAVRERSRPWAYRVEAFDSSVGSVHLLLRTVPPGSEPLYVDITYTLQWVDGDWRLAAPLNGDWGSVATSVKDIPQGYTIIGRP